MCSLNDTDINEIEEFMVKEPKIACDASTKCRKCNEKTAVVILRVRDAYCSECFLSATVHKFRSTLGKSKIMKPFERVLIGFSGGQSSTCLLHLIRGGLNETTHKRILFKPLVLYIDEGAALGQSVEERQAIRSAVSNTITKFDFPAYFATLDKSLDDNMDVENIYSSFETDDTMIINEENEIYLKKIVLATNNLTSREDLIEKLRMRLLLVAAKQLNCTKVFVADVGTNLAVRILSNISLGRGAQLPLDVGFCDARDPNIKILRPIRDFTKKEVAFYNNFHKLQEVFIPSIGTMSDSDASIQKLTEKFVTDLQNEFPSTISNVFRTGDKLSLSSDTPVSEESCILCNAPLDTAKLESSALQATEFSRKISNLGPSGFDSNTLGSLGESKPVIVQALPQSDCCSTGEHECKCSQGSEGGHHITWIEAEEFICYGCRLITREVAKSSAELPPQLVKTVRERSSYKKMREQIQDFLL